MKRTLLYIFATLCFISTQAQDIKVYFDLDISEPDSTYVKDYNNTPCAKVDVKCPQQKYNFEGDIFLQEKTNQGYTLWFTEGAEYVRIIPEKGFPLSYTFPIPLEYASSYSMDLRVYDRTANMDVFEYKHLSKGKKDVYDYCWPVQLRGFKEEDIITLQKNIENIVYDNTQTEEMEEIDEFASDLYWQKIMFSYVDRVGGYIVFRKKEDVSLYPNTFDRNYLCFYDIISKRFLKYEDIVENKKAIENLADLNLLGQAIKNDGEFDDFFDFEIADIYKNHIRFDFGAQDHAKGTTLRLAQMNLENVCSYLSQDFKRNMGINMTPNKENGRKVIIDSKVKNASVYVDGQKIGVTPCEYTLPYGSHTIYAINSSNKKSRTEHVFIAGASDMKYKELVWDDKYKTVVANGVPFTMVRVKGGSNEYAANMRDFYIGQVEVTYELWDAVMGTSSDREEDDEEVDDNAAACDIEYDEALTFIKRLNRITGMTFRLPTKREWEYAAHGGVLSHKYIHAGSNFLEEIAGEDSKVMTYPVARNLCNELGLYDMTGNASEWVQGKMLGGAVTTNGFYLLSEDTEVSSEDVGVALLGLRLALSCQ